MTHSEKLLRPASLNLAVEEYDIRDKPAQISISPIINESFRMMGALPQFGDIVRFGELVHEILQKSFSEHLSIGK
jgi:hypothetical protein